MPTTRAAQKQEAILQAAMELFLARGYAAVSLDDVLAATGGSKATVYRYFGSKDGLFEAVIVRICDNALDAVRALELGSLPLPAALLQLGSAILNILADPVAVEAYRLAISEAPRHPGAAQAYYRAAPEAAARVLASYLQERQAQGELRPELGDPQQLAGHFIDSLVHQRLMRALLGVAAVPPCDANDPFLHQAVAVFLRGIERGDADGTREAPPPRPHA